MKDPRDVQTINELFGAINTFRFYLQRNSAQGTVKFNGRLYTRTWVDLTARGIIRKYLPKYHAYLDRKFPELIETLYLYQKDPEIEKLKQLETDLFTKEQLDKLDQVRQLPEQQQPKALNIWATNLETTLASTPITTPSAESTLPSSSAPKSIGAQISTVIQTAETMPVSPAAKRTAAGLWSDAKVLVMRNFGKYLTASNAARLVSAGVGAAVGGGLTQSAMGAAIGAGTGLVIPDIIQRGGGEAILGSTESALNTPSPPQDNLSLSQSRGSFRPLGFFSGPRKYFIGASAGLLLVFLLMFLPLGEFGQLNTTPTAEAAAILKVVKSANKEAVGNGENIEYSIKVDANSLSGNQLTLTDIVPTGTTFVSASDNGQLNGSTITWNLNPIKQAAGSASRPLPPPTGPAPGFGRPVQKITVTVAQIRAELDKYSPQYSQYAQTIYDAGVKYNVDPAFIMAIWWMESHYSTLGGYTNNPGSIVYNSDGYLGMKKGVYNADRDWATWDTFAQGLEAIPALIATDYYPRGQTDTWTIHSGIDEKSGHAYHGRGDIGKYGDIKTWSDYVNFYYGWIQVMDRISGGSDYSISQTVKLVVKPNANDQWISNKAQAMAPGIGNISSNQIITKVGNALDKDKPTVSDKGFSCPLPGKRVIGCGSFMSDPQFNRLACAGSQPLDRGHCGRTYGCYAGSVEATNALRRAHSIDVDATVGETVSLPTVLGQSVSWTYSASYAVAPGDGGGTGHVFEAQLGSDKWVLHLVHMNSALIPPPQGRGYQSGDPITTVAATSYPHLHINIGKNPSAPNGGSGWLNPEDLGMCVN